MRIFKLIDAEKAHLPVALLCRMLGVSCSGYYAWRERPPSIGRRLEAVGIVPSMGRTGSALDNAMAESFVSTLKAELVARHRTPTREAAWVAIFEYIEGFYNRARRHSSLGYESPEDFEATTMEEVVAWR